VGTGGGRAEETRSHLGVKDLGSWGLKGKGIIKMAAPDGESVPGKKITARVLGIHKRMWEKTRPPWVVT